MITASFCFAPGLNEEQERLLWSRGIVSWQVARDQPDEVADILGAVRGAKLVAAVGEAQAALASGDAAWFQTRMPKEQLWRLWQGFAAPEQTALVDIETTGLTPGFDQITVIGLADGSATPSSRAFVWHRPQPGDEPLDRFREAMKGIRLVVTFNGGNFDIPFIERHFKDHGFRFDMPHLDLLWPARSLGLTGGLKDMEKQIGIVRGGDIAGVRGNEAVLLAGQWKNAGDPAAYRKLVTYCKADCANLRAFADHVHARLWERTFTAHARRVDFAKTKGQQLSIF